MRSNKRKFFIIVVALIVIGAVTGLALNYAYPVQMATLAGLTRNYIVSSTPAGTTTTELNAAYKAAEAVVASPAADAPSASATERRLAELQPNSHFGSLLAAQRDQYEKCRPAEGLVHLRRR